MLLVEGTIHLLVPDDYWSGNGVEEIFLDLFHRFEQLGFGVETSASDKIIDNLPELIILAEEKQRLAVCDGHYVIDPNREVSFRPLA